MRTHPLKALERVAEHQNVPADELIVATRVDDETFARDPLAPPRLDG